MSRVTCPRVTRPRVTSPSTCQALGPVGTLAHQRLTVMMADAGLVHGTMPPESEEDLFHVVEQAKTYWEVALSSFKVASE